MKLNRNIKPDFFRAFVNYFLGPLLFAWLSWSIYREVSQQPDLPKAWKQIRESVYGPMMINLIAVILLMVVNWGIEALKWQMAVRKVQSISFFKAFKATLSGVSFSVSTPNFIGEYLGRILYMDEGNRLRTISITIVSSISQLIMTLLMGLLGLIVLQDRIEASGIISSIWIQTLLYGVLAALVVTLMFYFRLPWLIRWIDRIPGIKRFTYLVDALESFDFNLLFRMLLLSALRFMVFIAQYFILFQLFDVHVSLPQVFWSVSVSFLVMAILPTPALAELGLRGKVSIILVGLFSANHLGIFMTSMSIWIFNLVIPAIAGSLFILGIRKILGRKSKDQIADA